MKAFRIMACLLLAVPLVTNAGSYSPTAESKHFTTEKRTTLSDAITKNLEKILNPSIANTIYQTGNIKRLVPENPVAVSDIREVFTKNLAKIHTPSIGNMIPQTADIKHAVTDNPVVVSEIRETFTNNLAKIRNPSIANTIYQTLEVKYAASEIQ